MEKGSGAYKHSFDAKAQGIDEYIVSAKALENTFKLLDMIEIVNGRVDRLNMWRLAFGIFMTIQGLCVVAILISLF